MQEPIYPKLIFTLKILIAIKILFIFLILATWTHKFWLKLEMV